MSISRVNWHKRKATGCRQVPIRKKRNFELGRPAAMTKLGTRRVHTVGTRAGNKKFRDLRLDTGNFSYGSESISRKSRIIDVVYNASNNELVRMKTLVKSCIVSIDGTPFRQWYEEHYALLLGRKKGVELTVRNKDRSRKNQKKYIRRKKIAMEESSFREEFMTGRLVAKITSRPGQIGKSDGIVLEGKELEFYMRKIKAKKGK